MKRRTAASGSSVAFQEATSSAAAGGDGAQAPVPSSPEGKVSSSASSYALPPRTNAEDPDEEQISLLPFGLSLPVVAAGLVAVASACGLAQKLGYRDVAHGFGLACFLGVFIFILADEEPAQASPLTTEKLLLTTAMAPMAQQGRRKTTKTSTRWIGLS